MADAPVPTSLLPRVRDPQFRELYANANQVGISPFDITIIFQKSTEIGPGVVGLIDLVSVTMSPQNFKSVATVMTETLKAYENVFGVLAIPEADTKPIRDAAGMEKMMQAARAQKEEIAAQITSSNEPPPPSKRSRGASQKKER